MSSRLKLIYMSDDQNNPQDDNLDLVDPDDSKHQAAKPPSVTGEEDPFSGDATSSESPDIDEELKKSRPLGR